MNYVLDTHVWVWWHVDPGRLSPNAASVLKPDAGNELALPAICVWELAKLVEKGRIAFSQPVEQWISQALTMPGLRVIPLSPAVAIESARLPGSFHSDPADQMIVATARLLGAAVVTADARVRAYRYVSSIW